MTVPTIIFPARSHAIASDLRAQRGSEKVKDDFPTLMAYAVDASIYRMVPKAVVLVESEDDIMKTIGYAVTRGISLTPRAAGTKSYGFRVRVRHHTQCLPAQSDSGSEPGG